VNDPVEIPCIYVLAGTNGAGKSSIIGKMLLQRGAEYFNPDEAARRIRLADAGISLQQANTEAWQQGVRLLRRAIAQRSSFALETTLGGRTIAALLESAASSGMEVRIWYVALDSPELHIQRVRLRVQKGGHDIPDERIRARYDQSRLNLIRLLPKLTELRVYDNSKEADPDAGLAPELQLILHLERGRIVASCELTSMPDWAKAIFMEVIKLRPQDQL
jgi:predicted ABC-type ATPase